MIMIINLLSCGIIIASAVWGYRLGFHRSFIRLTVFCISVLSGLFFSRIFATLFVNFDLSLFRITNLPGLLSSIIKDYLPGDIIYRSYYIQIIITEITVAILRVAFFTIWAVISIILSMVFPIKKQIRKDSISKRLLGSALGVIQTLLFILLIGSLIKGLTVCFVSEKDAFRKELSNTIPMKVSNYCLYDCLFSITYQNERINLRQDILWFQKNQDLIEDNDYNDLYKELDALNSIELIGATIAEILILKQTEYVDDDVYKKIAHIKYREEIVSLYTAYQDFCALELYFQNDYWDLPPDLVLNLTNNLGKIQTLNIIMPYFLDDIGALLDLSEYGINLEDYESETVIWTDEIKTIGYIYEVLYDLRLLKLDNDDIPYEKMTADKIGSFVRMVTSSRFFSLNQEKIVQGVIGALPEKYHNLSFGKVADEELTDILLFVKLLSENGFFGNRFSSLQFLTENNIEAVVRLLLGSELMRKNLQEILMLLFEEKDLPLEVFDFPQDVDWIGDEGSKELCSLFYLARVFNTKEKYRELVMENLQTLIASGLYTKIIYRNISKIIDYINNNYLGEEFYIIEDGIDWEDGRDEFYAIMNIYYRLLETKCFYNLNNPWEVLTYLEDEDIDTILASQLISQTLINYLCNLPDGFDILKVNLLPDDEKWFSDLHDEGELKKLLRGLNIIALKQEEDVSSFDINIFHRLTTGYRDEADDELSIILQSQILYESLVYNIKSLKRNPNTGDGILIIDIYEEDWLDSPPPYFRPGEIRNFLRALQLLFPDGIDLHAFTISQEHINNLSNGTVDTNGDNIIDDADDNDLREILRSKIISDTVIFLALDFIR